MFQIPCTPRLLDACARYGRADGASRRPPRSPHAPRRAAGCPSRTEVRKAIPGTSSILDRRRSATAAHPHESSSPRRRARRVGGELQAGPVAAGCHTRRWRRGRSRPMGNIATWAAVGGVGTPAPATGPPPSARRTRTTSGRRDLVASRTTSTQSKGDQDPPSGAAMASAPAVRRGWVAVKIPLAANRRQRREVRADELRRGCTNSRYGGAGDLVCVAVFLCASPRLALTRADGAAASTTPRPKARRRRPRSANRNPPLPRTSPPTGAPMTDRGPVRDRRSRSSGPAAGRGDRLR